jgi:hypothetical protein
MGKPIYVEIPIRVPLEELWRLTQTPDLHQRWDLRFTRIAYLPRPDSAAPQRFVYETRIGFGRAVSGEGETVDPALRNRGGRDEPDVGAPVRVSRLVHRGVAAVLAGLGARARPPGSRGTA